MKESITPINLSPQICYYSDSFCTQYYGIMCSLAQSCPTLCDSIVCSLPGSCVHRILQARTLEWAAISFSLQHNNPPQFWFRKKCPLWSPPFSPATPHPVSSEKCPPTSSISACAQDSLKVQFSFYFLAWVGQETVQGALFLLS